MPSGDRRIVRRAAVVVMLVAGLLSPAVPSGAGPDADRALASAGRAPTTAFSPRPPVSATPHVLPIAGARVLAPFDAPAHDYGPGHRGVDLDAPVGTGVASSGAGVVVFAGPVAGATWVTVDHGADLRTSYGPLADLAVTAATAVRAGQRIGVATGHAHPRAPGLHWSARLRGRYLDPLTLIGRRRPTLIGPGGWRLGAPAVAAYEPWDGRHRFGLVPSSPVATAPGWTTPPNPHRVVTIAGLGSTSADPALDVTHLGYDRSDVTRFSYAEGRGHARPPPYGASDTWRGVRAAAHLLRDDLRAAWRAEPGRAVDLVGHSMGGLVALYYLLALHDPSDPTLPPIGHVVTIATPVGGADLARLLVAAPPGLTRAALHAALWAADGHDPRAPAYAELAVGSEVVGEVLDGWARAQADPARSPLATGTEVMTFGGSRDLIVSATRSGLGGADHVTLPGGHDHARRTQAARLAVRAFLAGDPVPGESGGLATWAGRLVGLSDDLVAGPLP